MENGQQSQTKTIIIEPKKGWRLINWKELRDYRDLLYFLVLRDVKVLYRQTVLGFAWAFLRPLFSMVVFSVVFGGLAKVPSDGLPYPVFAYSALVPWTYFSSTLMSSTTSLIGGRGLFLKVYFPRLIIPFTPVLAKLVDFAIALTFCFGLMLFYGIVPTVNIAWIPLLVCLMILTSSGIGMWLSALALQYRDIKFGITFMSQLLMYAAPVVWPISLITEKFGDKIKLIYGLYPMAGVITGFRSALLGHMPLPYDLIGMGTITAVILFITGALYFRRKERIFADVI